MAYTQPCLDLDAETGKCAVYLVDPSNPTDDTPLWTPTLNASVLARVIAHSDLNYIHFVYDQTLTVNYPVRSSSGGSASYPFPNHGLGVIPTAVCMRGATSSLYPNTRVQTAGGSSRTAHLALTTTGASINEEWAVQPGQQSQSLAAFSETYRLFLLTPIVPDSGMVAWDINPEGGYVQLGRGKFDTRGPAKLRIAQSGGLFSVPVLGPTIDSLGAGMRFTYPDGVVIDTLSYAGSFTAPGFHQIVPG